MLMVLNLHSFSGYEHGSGILQALDFFRQTTSICAVDVFILISGFWGIRWKKKSFYNLIFQVFYYSFFVYIFCVSIGILEFKTSQFIECFKALFNSWGFVTNYITLYFLSPLLNSFVAKNDNKNLIIYISILFFAENFVFNAGSGPINYCLLYLIGRWLKNTNSIENLKIRPLLAYIITTIAIFIIVYIIYLNFHVGATKMNSLVIGYSYSSPLVILQAVFLFLFFGRLNIQNKLINWMAASCFSIFLIHMHPAIKYIGYYGFTESLYEKPLLEHVYLLFVLICAVFGGSIMVDKVRLILSDFLYKLCHYIKDFFPHSTFRAETFLPQQIKKIL